MNDFLKKYKKIILYFTLTVVSFCLWIKSRENPHNNKLMAHENKFFLIKEITTDLLIPNGESITVDLYDSTGTLIAKRVAISKLGEGKTGRKITSRLSVSLRDYELISGTDEITAFPPRFPENSVKSRLVDERRRIKF